MTIAPSKKSSSTVSVEVASVQVPQGDASTDDLPRRSKTNPLPRLQLAIVYTIKLVVPVASTQVLPYVNKMVARMDLPAGGAVGYYSGLLSTAHTAGQIITIFFWGRLSDRIGRTPVLAIGMAGLGISTFLFGITTTFSTALYIRFLTGVFSGFIGVVHSVVGELSDETNQSTAFPFYDIISALGFIVGPLIGGTFAEPAAEYPRWFDIKFFVKYPYVLPCIISAVLAFVAALLSVTVLRETHPRKLAPPAPVDIPTSYGSIQVPVAPLIVIEKPPNLKSLLALPVIRAICSSQWMLGFVAACFNVVFVLMSYTEVTDGGLSMNPRKIASALSIMGLVSMALKASLPIFLRRFDALTVFRFTLQTWPLTFAGMPLLNLIARYTSEHQSFTAQALLWLAITIVLFMSRLGSLAFSIVMILTKDHTPTSYALGTTNSISELSQMLGIAVGAPFVSSLFAFSTSHHIMNGYGWVFVVCILSLFGDFSASRIAKYRFASD